MENLPEVRLASTPSLPERVAHREWIGGRCVTLLSHYWRDDDPVELTAAIGADWAEVLEGLPQNAIHRACIAWLRDSPDRKPKPGNIYALAREFMPRPVIVARSPEPDIPRERMSAERAAEIMAEVGFRPKRMGDANEGL